MKRRTYMIVFPGGNVLPLAHDNGIGNAIEQGDSIYFVDENVGFVGTGLSIDSLTKRLEKALGSKIQFFVADISHADRAGNMVSRFWEFLHEEEQVAAE
jgi:hypothetical protein